MSLYTPDTAYLVASADEWIKRSIDLTTTDLFQTSVETRLNVRAACDRAGTSLLANKSTCHFCGTLVICSSNQTIFCTAICTDRQFFGRLDKIIFQRCLPSTETVNEITHWTAWPDFTIAGQWCQPDVSDGLSSMVYCLVGDCQPRCRFTQTTYMTKYWMSSVADSATNAFLLVHDWSVSQTSRRTSGKPLFIGLYQGPGFCTIQ